MCVFPQVNVMGPRLCDAPVQLRSKTDAKRYGEVQDHGIEETHFSPYSVTAAPKIKWVPRNQVSHGATTQGTESGGLSWPTNFSGFESARCQRLARG